MRVAHENKQSLQKYMKSNGSKGWHSPLFVEPLNQLRSLPNHTNMQCAQKSSDSSGKRVAGMTGEG